MKTKGRERRADTECLNGDVGRREEGCLWVGGGVGGAKGEINQVKAIRGNGCCSAIRKPVTQQLL